MDKNKSTKPSGDVPPAEATGAAGDGHTTKQTANEAKEKSPRRLRPRTSPPADPAPAPARPQPLTPAQVKSLKAHKKPASQRAKEGDKPNKYRKRRENEEKARKAKEKLQQQRQRRSEGSKKAAETRKRNREAVEAAERKRIEKEEERVKEQEGWERQAELEKQKARDAAKAGESGKRKRSGASNDDEQGNEAPRPKKPKTAKPADDKKKRKTKAKAPPKKPAAPKPDDDKKKPKTKAPPTKPAAPKPSDSGRPSVPAKKPPVKAGQATAKKQPKGKTGDRPKDDSNDGGKATEPPTGPKRGTKRPATDVPPAEQPVAKRTRSQTKNQDSPGDKTPSKTKSPSKEKSPPKTPPPPPPKDKTPPKTPRPPPPKDKTPPKTPPPPKKPAPPPTNLPTSGDSDENEKPKKPRGTGSARRNALQKRRGRLEWRFSNQERISIGGADGTSFRQYNLGGDANNCFWHAFHIGRIGRVPLQSEIEDFRRAALQDKADASEFFGRIRDDDEHSSACKIQRGFLYGELDEMQDDPEINVLLDPKNKEEYAENPVIQIASDRFDVEVIVFQPKYQGDIIPALAEAELEYCLARGESRPDIKQVFVMLWPNAIHYTALIPTKGFRYTAHIAPETYERFFPSRDPMAGWHDQSQLPARIDRSQGYADFTPIAENTDLPLFHSLQEGIAQGYI